MSPHRVKYLALLTEFNGLNITVKDLISEMDKYDEGTGPSYVNAVMRSATALDLTSLEGLRLLNAKQTVKNSSGKALPPVLHLGLAELSLSDFVNVASVREERFENQRGSETVDVVVADDRELRWAVGAESGDHVPMSNSRMLVRSAMASWQLGYRLTIDFQCCGTFRAESILSSKAK